MRHLIKGQTYTNNKTDLAFIVHAVRYSSDKYVKVKGTLIIKRNNFTVEGPKNYKLYWNLIADWYIV